MRNLLGLQYPNDSHLLELIRKNDDRAFTLLYHKYRNPLLSYAALYLSDRDSCEEVLQQLFVQLHIKRISLKISTNVSSYLFTAMRNKIFNFLRDKSVYKKHVNNAAKANPVTQDDADHSIKMKQLEEEINFSLENMPVKYREVYVLHNHDRLTIKKISELLNRPADTVEKQFRKATELLRDCLKNFN